MPFYVYQCGNAHCRHVNEIFARAMPEGPVADQVPCEKCGKAAARSFRAEQGHMRCGDLPDWVSNNAGVTRADIPRANRHYAKMGVHFDEKGRAHVPGNVRNKFLKERGLMDLGRTGTD